MQNPPPAGWNRAWNTGMKAMLQRLRGILGGLGLYGLWAALAAFLVLAFYQMHTTVVFIAIRMVENPATRPPGWSTATVTGVSRFVILILGALWLVLVSLLESYLHDFAQRGILLKRTISLSLAILAIFGISYAVLVILSQ